MLLSKKRGPTLLLLFEIRGIGTVFIFRFIFKLHVCVYMSVWIHASECRFLWRLEVLGMEPGTSASTANALLNCHLSGSPRYNFEYTNYVGPSRL